MMRVVVVGAGIGGLACAQGLARQGHDVQVVERDKDLSQTGGYKLHLGAPALSALRELLPATSFEALLGSAVATRGFSLVVRDHRGRRLLAASEPTAGLSLDIDRITLRRVLALQLEDRIGLGRTCQGWRMKNERIVAELDGGVEISADVLVIADGAGSKLAQTLAGRPTAYPCGLTGIAGRTPWDRLPPETAALLADEPMLAIGPGGTGLFASAHDPVRRAAIRTPNTPRKASDPVVIWGLIAVEQAVPSDIDKLGQARLVEASEHLLRRHRWADHVVELVTRSQVESVSAFRFNAADPDDLAPWRSSRVTALGDAVHAMPPTGGQGAAAAILDAHDLTKRFHGVARGNVTPLVAIHDYEAELRIRAAPAIRESLQPVGWIRASATPAGALLLRAATPLMATGAAVARAVPRRSRR